MSHRNTRPLRITLQNLKMPSDFSVTPYESCYDRVVQKARVIPDSAHWINEFSLSWLAIAYRFRSCAEYDKSFTASVKRAGATPVEPERYIQERDLYNFFVSGLSSLESMGYGLYFIGFVLEPTAFGLAVSSNDFRRIDLKNTVVRDFMRSSFAQEQISSKLNALIHHSNYIQWEKIRNILAHRITPVRTGVHTIIESLDPNYSGPTSSHWVDWLEGLQINKYTTESLRAWLISTLNDFFHVIDMFFQSKF